MLLVFCGEQVLLAFEIFVACCQLVFLSQTDPCSEIFLSVSLAMFLFAATTPFHNLYDHFIETCQTYAVISY